jgi:hypothetical protein
MIIRRPESTTRRSGRYRRRTADPIPRELGAEPDHVGQARQQHRLQQRPVDLPAGPGPPRRAVGEQRTRDGELSVHIGQCQRLFARTSRRRLHHRDVRRRQARTQRRRAALVDVQADPLRTSRRGVPLVHRDVDPLPAQPVREGQPAQAGAGHHHPHVTIPILHRLMKNTVRRVRAKLHRPMKKGC